jgi:ABC-type lipoprotein export system ATPase subunit
VVVTHDHRALDIFDRTLEMEDGKLAEAATTPADPSNG